MGDLIIGAPAANEPLPRAPSEDKPKEDTGLPVDSFRSSPGGGHPHRLKPSLILSDCKEISRMAQVRERMPVEPLVTESSAGWKAQIATRHSADTCYATLPMAKNTGNMLVFFTENAHPQHKAHLAVMNNKHGPMEIPDSTGVSYESMAAASTDGSRTYMIDRRNPSLQIFDETLKKMRSIDLKTHPDHETVISFFSGKEGEFVYLAPWNSSSEKGYLVAIDPSDGSTRWRKEFDTVYGHDIQEGPDGHLYLKLGYDRQKNNKIVELDRSGNIVSEMPTPGPVDEYLVPENGILVYTVKGLKEKLIARNSDKLRAEGQDLKSGGILSKLARIGRDDPSLMWVMKEDYSHLKLFPDKKHLLCVRNKQGEAIMEPVPGSPGASILKGYHCDHGICKIDMASGDVIGQYDVKEREFMDYALVGNDIFAMSLGPDHKKVFMTRLDEGLRETWTGEFATEEVKISSKGNIHAVTPGGEFMFGNSAGEFVCLRPKEEEDTLESLKESLDVTGLVMKELQDNLEMREGNQETPEEHGILHDEQWLVIDGVKLRKN
jgi:hypothetical protein